MIVLLMSGVDSSLIHILGVCILSYMRISAMGSNLGG